MIIPKKTMRERIKHSRFVSAIKRPFKPLFQHRVEMALDIIDLQNEIYKMQEDKSAPVMEFKERLNKLEDRIDELDYAADEQERRFDNHDPFEHWGSREYRELMERLVEHINIRLDVD